MVLFLSAPLVIQPASAAIITTTRYGENAWISTDPDLTGKTGNAQIRTSNIYNLGAKGYGGFWYWEDGTAQITIDTLLGNDKFYAISGSTLYFWVKWKFNGYIDDIGSKSGFKIGYAVERDNVDLEDISSTWIWSAPNNDYTSWNNEIITHGYYSSYIETTDYYRIAIAMAFWQLSHAQWGQQHWFDFYNSGKEIELQSVTVTHQISPGE